jgi:hypothetical protein
MIRRSMLLMFRSEPGQERLEQAVDLVRDGDHRVQLGLELCEKAVHP